MSPIRLVAMILAIICFVLAAFEVKLSHGNLLAAGLAFWALAVTVT